MSDFVGFGLNYAKVTDEFIKRSVVSEDPLVVIKGGYQCTNGVERSILLLNIRGKENKVIIENNQFGKVS